ncbi:hypothetical protein GWK48_01865 [Metallosphaera tengchongensis]|uniref:Uncharacterized protein n=1 Tax=Metallosphaera tengchongensis TaxID=1532350 RepID=A0A6N0NUZ3_9CREN|nr:hypothetical protein [Metallosphaera tengchongensis]QKQ99307.1 hypothetical protein GWK48_01865 [Metallosphaera tengchongensis]
MPWGFFRNKDKPKFERDKLGEWALVTANKDLSFLTEVISKSLSRSGSKKNQIYILQFGKDSSIPGLFSIKGMVETSQNLSENSFQDSLRKSFDDLGNLGEIRTVKLRLCNDIFLFFNFNLFLKRIKTGNREVKLLVPPLGVSSSQIPYSPDRLFNTLIGAENDPCSVESDLVDSRMMRLVFNCRKFTLDHFRVKQSFSYFLDDMLGLRVKTKTTSSNSLELEVVLLNLKKEYLIPLLWDNFLTVYPSC